MNSLSSKICLTHEENFIIFHVLPNGYFGSGQIIFNEKQLTPTVNCIPYMIKK